MALVYAPRNTLASNDQDAYTLPHGFPEAIASSMAWTGADLADERTFVYQLTADDVAEINAALEIFKSYELDGDLANRENFPLPKLQQTLEKLAHEVYNGKGLFLIRGLRPEMYSVDDSMVIFMGLQAYIAVLKGRQDARGNMIVHIIPDTESPEVQRALHARHSTKQLKFHTEVSGDILAWQTRGAATIGGECILASAHSIYNFLAATCPEMIRTLAEPNWPFAFPTFHRRPILYHHNNRLIINYSPSALIGTASHPRSASLPSCTPEQRTALDALEKVARKFEVAFTTQPGDIHFVNNMTVLHRRSAFVDCAADAAKRHLVRMRLRSAARGYALPPHLCGPWEEAFRDEGDRDWHIYPMPEGYFPAARDPE